MRRACASPAKASGIVSPTRAIASATTAWRLRLLGVPATRPPVFFPVAMRLLVYFPPTFRPAKSPLLGTLMLRGRFAPGRNESDLNQGPDGGVAGGRRKL